MNQCVPSWELDHDHSSLPRLNFQAHPASNSSNSLPRHVPSQDYEVAELTWENGQVTMHGLGPPRLLVHSSFPPPSKYGAWDKPPPAGGTLESVVDQATRLQSHPKSGDNGNDLVPWFDYHSGFVNTGPGVAMDALVPCDNKINNNNNSTTNQNHENSTHVQGGFGTCVGSCSGATAASLDGCNIAGVGISSCKTNGSVSESATCRQTTTFDTPTCERDLGCAACFTSPSLASAENTTSTPRKEYTKSSGGGGGHDSVGHSRSQREAGNEESRKKGSGKSSVSTKRSRAAAIHNQSERKRRDKINDRMRTLQKLVPNSSKTDKASMLDEVIEYLKQLQTQVQVINRMVPLAMQQQLQMSMMTPLGIGMGMGIGIGMPGMVDMNAMNRMLPLIPPLVPLQPPWDNPGDRLPVMPDPLLAFLACQSQPINMEAYSRLAALYQQFQQSVISSFGSGSKN